MSLLEIWREQAFNSAMHLEVLSSVFSTYVAESKIIQSGYKKKKGLFFPVSFVMI